MNLLSWPSTSERNGSLCDLRCIRMNKSSFCLYGQRLFKVQKNDVLEKNTLLISLAGFVTIFSRWIVFRHSDAIVSCPAALGEFGLVVSEATSLLVCRHWVDPSLQLLFWQDQNIFLQGNCSVTSQVFAIPTTLNSHWKFHKNVGCHTQYYFVVVLDIP